MINDRKVSLSITSSKRLPLLKRVLRAFAVFCNDIEDIDDVIFFDDSSSQQEKSEMESLIRELFPTKNIIIEHFYPDSFTDSYRHSRILNRWREVLVETGSNYCFHLEDDYLFVDFFDLETGVHVLNLNDECGYVGYFQSYKKFPQEFQPKIFKINETRFWEWIYKTELPINEHLFIDDVGAIQTLNNNGDFWMMYINWPHFSLRPGIHDVKKLLSIGEFSTNYDTNTMRTELEFAIRWSKKFKTLCHEKFMVINLAWDANQSSYTLNESN